MLEIILCIIIWTWNLTPLWVNIVVSVLAFMRFSYSTSKTIGEFIGSGDKTDQDFSN